jgi:sugar-specific transcriptional regulator TrmB
VARGVWGDRRSPQIYDAMDMLPSYPVVQIVDGKMQAYSAKKPSNKATLELEPRVDYADVREKALAELRKGPTEKQAVSLVKRISDCHRAMDESHTAAIDDARILNVQVTETARQLHEELATLAPNGAPNAARIRKLVERIAKLREIQHDSKQMMAVARHGVGSSVVYTETKAPDAQKAADEVIRIVFNSNSKTA